MAHVSVNRQPCFTEEIRLVVHKAKGKTVEDLVRMEELKA